MTKKITNPAKGSTARIRCAIYTRKSSEEGLEQDYNSLHAQRDACEAYVRSQVSEGWTALPTAYDDGGISGGTMDRPGLKQLLKDVEAGKIDVVVVYKVDRLTRSLTDFGRIIETFEKAGASFVSVTQAFNTTTSMGRLTLNVLLSFAQFEREVTGERIRDKIAASKAKGMWMGGLAPFGYDKPADPNSRTLVINPGEAETVRRIYTRYLELKSVHVLQRELEAEGVRTKVTVSARSGISRGGVPWMRGPLYHLLRNRTYLGEIVHKDQRFPGLHAAILDTELFDAVQAGVASNVRPERDDSTVAAKAPLRGLVTDGDGNAMTPAFSQGRSGRLYRYYVSAALQRGEVRASSDAIQRVPAPALEAFVRRQLARVSKDAATLEEALRRVEIHAESVHLLLDSQVIFGPHSDPAAALVLLRQKLGAEDRLSLEADGSLRLIIAHRLKPVGGRSWASLPTGEVFAPTARADASLNKALKSAHKRLNAVDAGTLFGVGRSITAKGPANPHLRLILPLAFLAPDIQVFDPRRARGCCQSNGNLSPVGGVLPYPALA